MDKKKESKLSFPEKGIESFIVRLKELLGEGSLRSFAQAIDASEGGVRKWFTNSTKPAFDKVVKISRLYKVNLEWLATGEGPKYPGEQSPTTVSETVVITSNEFTEDYSLIPGYHILVSTGHGELNQDEEVTRHLAFRNKWLRYRGFEASSLSVVFAHGDSMEPTIQNNNSLLVNVDDSKLTDGSIFVLRFGDELYAKRLQKRFDGSVELISDNKEYNNQIVNVDEIEKLHIIGKVVWIGKDLY
jgi:phage repressor protein C with HTH and peptisase S24 domain